jgi:hypothetical protein
LILVHDTIYVKIVLKVRSKTNLSRQTLEANLAEGIQLEMRVVGMLLVANDVTPSLVARGIAKLEVRGVLRAAPDLREVLAQKMA